MKYFSMLVELVLQFMRTPFTIYGYTFSMFSVFMTVMVFGLVCLVVRGMFNQ